MGGLELMFHGVEVKLDVIGALTFFIIGIAWFIRLERNVFYLEKENKEARIVDKVEIASWVQNLREAKVEPLEKNLKRLEGDHMDLSKALQLENKNLQTQLGGVKDLLSDIRVVLAKMETKLNMDSGSSKV